MVCVFVCMCDCISVLADARAYREPPSHRVSDFGHRRHR